jgi:DNA polymerase III delta prime subunit
MSSEQFLWVEKYRPRTIEDCILPDHLKKVFQQFVDQKNIPNLLLTGSAGVGKTTVARAMLEQVGADYIIINGSLNGNIDTLRNEIMQFASSVSFKGGRKYVILDEADYLNPQSTQPSLRNFMEEFSKNCGFILTCNYKNRIIPPLHSRCSVVEFKIAKKDKPTLASQFMKRVFGILQKENINFDKEVVVEIITRFFPDWRRVLNEIQRHSASGSIDSSIFGGISSDSYKDLVGALKNKNFTAMRKWVGEHSDTDTTSLFRNLYDNAAELLVPGSIPNLILTIADYQYKAAFVADQEINVVACMTEIMRDCTFK